MSSQNPPIDEFGDVNGPKGDDGPEGGGYAFVRTEEAPNLPPPSSEVGFLGWLWRNMFSSMSNFSTPSAAIYSLLMIAATVLVGYFGVSFVWGIFKFAVVDAVWWGAEGMKREACTTTLQGGELPPDWYGACYPYISAKWKLFVYGRFPDEEVWRVNLVYLIGGLGVSWLISESIPYRRQVGVAMVGLGAAYGLLVASPEFYGETFGARVGVQLLIGIGIVFALIPPTFARRTVGILMLTLYPLAAFMLLTGGDLEIGSGFWVVVGVMTLIACSLAIATRSGALGEAGAAFAGVATTAAAGLLILYATAFLASSRFVDMVEAVAGETVTEREAEAIAWWADNNRVDAPLLASSIARINAPGWGDAEAEALALQISEDLGGVWDVPAAMQTVRRFLGDELDTFPVRAMRRLEAAIVRRAEAPPTPRQIAQLAIATGLQLEDAELSRLEAINWRPSFLNVASSPGARIAWPLPVVETNLWGGLLVTLVVAIVGILFSLPLGVLLALGRRSSLPVIRLLSIVFIEFWRGVPLITVLFMSSVMLPLFVPSGVDFNELLSALIGVMLFSAAYQAEVVRGGLQAIPKGQFEASNAMGLQYWQSMRLIILPQALTLVIPGIVNTFIGLFKDTALVGIIGLFDLLEGIKSSFSDATWATPVQEPTGYLVACVIYFLFCFAMSRYSLFMERKLRKGHAR